jgi:hypothetical protein
LPEILHTETIAGAVVAVASIRDKEPSFLLCTTEAMHKNILKLLILIVMLTGLPLIGITVSGYDISKYLEFPPITHYVTHTPFSFPVFLGLGLLIFLTILPFIYRTIIFISAKSDTTIQKKASFPWWGYAGLVTGLTSWILAWTRFGWFSSLQLHTFLPLWLSYILIVNALTKRRKGSCLMTKHPRAFLSLFPVSISFWWFFEYLNRFVQNWYYVEMSRFTSLEYFLLASLSFSTVLPAVLSTKEYLLSFPFFKRAFGAYVKLNPKSPKLLACVFFIISGISLACIGLFPNYLFPLLWISPLIIVVSLQALANEKHILSDLSEGRWTVVFASAVSALICGFFWEMWNYFSQAKWIYSIPFVHRFHLFEMPLLGYAGYLPFGLECAAIGDMIISAFSSEQN